MNNRIAELQVFLKESPDDPFLKYALTTEYKKLGDTEKTLAGFQDLYEHHPDYVGAYYHFAKFLEEQGQKEKALTIYQEGMQKAQEARNRHAYNELLGAYNLAMGVDEDDWDD